jgi:sec-independent protein translocase protein TatC
VKFPLVLAGIQEKIVFQQLEPIGGFMAVMNLSIVAGIVVSSPLLMYFILQFVLPGLRTTEKKVLFPALAVGGGLFLLGAMFAYFLVAPRALTFFQGFNSQLSEPTKSMGEPMMLEIDFSPFKDLDWLHLPSTPVTIKATPLKPALQPTFWGISHYVKFICQFILIFGLCFELPVVVMALVKLDILSYKVMKTTRSWALISIAVIAMIVAPSPDVFTLLLIAVPLYCLYEVCIWIAWWMEKRDRELYPEHYKALEEDEKAMAADEWDNENYNPWNSDESDDDELHPSPRPAPRGTHPMIDPHAHEPAAHPPTEVKSEDVKPSDSAPPANPPSSPDVPYGGGNYHPDEPNKD